MTKYTTGDAIAGCGQLNAACICANKDFLSDIACCLAGSCSPEDQAKAVTFAQQICTANGITVPSAVSCTRVTTSVPIPSTISQTPTVTGGVSTTANAATITSSSSKGPAPTHAPAHAAGGLLGAAVAALALL